MFLPYGDPQKMVESLYQMICEGVFVLFQYNEAIKRYRKIVFLLAAILIVAMVPCAVSAEYDASIDVISSAEEVVETVLPTSITGGAVGMAVDAKSAILIDAGSGTVLFEQNSHDKLPPASVTKVMTMLLIMEAIDRGQMTLKKGYHQRKSRKHGRQSNV